MRDEEVAQELKKIAGLEPGADFNERFWKKLASYQRKEIERLRKLLAIYYSEKMMLSACGRIPAGDFSFETGRPMRLPRPTRTKYIVRVLN
jgi:hypothetical protein